MHFSKQADNTAITQLDKGWGEAASSKNLDAVVAFYAEDGTLVWPDQPPVHGSANIRTAWSGAFQEMPNVFLQFTPERIDVSESGDLASDFGVVTMGTEGPQGPKVTGKYVVVWKKVDGSWKVLYDSWNYNEKQQ